MLQYQTPRYWHYQFSCICRLSKMQSIGIVKAVCLYFFFFFFFFSMDKTQDTDCHYKILACSQLILLYVHTELLHEL